MKRPHLVLYDYGQGGVWAFILAASTEAIKQKYPKLAIYDEPPKWMTPADVDDIRGKMTIDIDDNSNPLLASLRRTEQGLGDE